MVQPAELDEFTLKLNADDARVLVDLLKLAVAGRAGCAGRNTLAKVLIALANTYCQVGEMVLELCVTELEDVAVDTESGRNIAQPVVQESPHPYIDDTSLTGTVRIPGIILTGCLQFSPVTCTLNVPCATGAEGLRVEFDRQCSTERRHDPLTLMDSTGRTVSIRSGREWSDWCQELRVSGEEIKWKFTSDGSVNGWGWRLVVNTCKYHPSIYQLMDIMWPSGSQYTPSCQQQHPWTCCLTASCSPGPPWTWSCVSWTSRWISLPTCTLYPAWQLPWLHVPSLALLVSRNCPVSALGKWLLLAALVLC